MLNEKQKSEIRKRLSEIPDLGHRDQGQRTKLEQQFDLICGLEDNSDRIKKERLLQKELLDLENYVTYLKGRLKI